MGLARVHSVRAAQDDVSGVRLEYSVVGPAGAVCFYIATRWYTPALAAVYQGRLKRRSDPHAHCRPTPVLFALCKGSTLDIEGADDMFDQLVARGESELWRRLELLYGATYTV